MNKQTVTPFSLKDAPSLIEKLLPAQKLSIETFKEREGRQSQTLTALGSYWKGRKPLILNKACILGALLPATNNLKRDLEVFEMLMGMDDESFLERWGSPTPAFIVESLQLPNLYDYFEVTPPESLPGVTPLRLDDFSDENGAVPVITWKEDVPENEQRRLEIEAIAQIPYLERVEDSKRPEQVGASAHAHIWHTVNAHLGTDADSFPELCQQLGLMRFGHRPRVADTFSGSGQIPFEAARLGCEVYASDLNPIACMLTWGTFNVVGASEQLRAQLAAEQKELTTKVQAEINKLGIESAGPGVTAKVFLYCVEATCPETGWAVPLLPSRVVSKGHKTIAKLIPDAKHKRYNIEILNGVSESEFKAAEQGTVADGALVHTVNGKTYRTKITTLRGDYTERDGSTKNKLRYWVKSDFVPRDDDIYRERLYAVQWQKVVRVNGKDKTVSEFRSVSKDDLKREQTVIDYVSQHLAGWQKHGYIPDTKIEPGEKTDEPIRTRGWTYWHHLFNPRQLLVFGLLNATRSPASKYPLFQAINNNCRLSRWNAYSGVGQTASVFDNQALNTLFNYGGRGFGFLDNFLSQECSSYPLAAKHEVVCAPANELQADNDIYITDPPFGDAVKYEEILEFFIAWLRKSPPDAFKGWVWDSRRALAIKGEDDDFRKGMVSAYRKMAEKMPSNGIQIIMFTHQSGSIWADMANIVWASGLHVTAAWYVATETDSALRGANNVKGTVLLVLRRREGQLKTNRGELAWELADEVNEQVRTLTGLNQETKDLYRDDNLFSDADLQMAGYAAALRVLTRYSIIDGRDMVQESQRPRVKGQQTLVDELIEFAVGIANQALVPTGIDKSHWDRLTPAERFYLKMLDLEAQGLKTVDNYQNFAKAFKVKDFKPFMASDKANSARLKSAEEFGRGEMNESSELFNTPLRGILYGLMELQKDMDGDDVVAHLSHNIPDYYDQREAVVEVADYLAKKLESLRPEEASEARVLRDLVRNQRL